MWRAASGLINSSRLGRSVVSRSLQRLGDADHGENLQRDEAHENSEKRSQKCGSSPHRCGPGVRCMQLFGTAAVTVGLSTGAVHEFGQLASDFTAWRARNRVEVGEELNSVQNILASAWNPPTLVIREHRVLPTECHLQDNPDIVEPHFDKDASSEGFDELGEEAQWLTSDACAQTDLPPTCLQQKSPVNDLREAEVEFDKVVQECESTVHNWIGIDLVRQGLFGEAFKYFHKASAGGHFKATYNLGMCYYKGYGTRSCMTKAAELWKKAGEQGHGTALYQLGVCYLCGIGVQKDSQEGVRLIDRAADLNVPEAHLYKKSADLQSSQAMDKQSCSSSKTKSVSFWARDSDDCDTDQSSAESGSSPCCRNNTGLTNQKERFSSEESIIFCDQDIPPKCVPRQGLPKSQTVHDFRRKACEAS